MSSRFREIAVRGAFALALALTAITAIGFGSVGAQDAAACVSPGLDLTAAAAPEAAASPVAVSDTADTTAPEGEPADAGVAALVTDTILNYAACFNEGQATDNAALYLALQSDAYLAESVAATESGTIDELIASEIEGDPNSVEVQSIENAMVHADGRVSGDASVLINGVWFTTDRIVLALADDLTWRWDADYYLRPEPQDVDTISVQGVSIGTVTDEETGEESVGLSLLGGGTATEGGALIFNISNGSESAYDVSLVSLEEGVTAADAVASDGEGTTFVGWVGPLMSGETKDMAFIDLPAGNYALLAFAEDGSVSAVDFVVNPAEA